MKKLELSEKVTEDFKQKMSGMLSTNDVKFSEFTALNWIFESSEDKKIRAFNRFMQHVHMQDLLPYLDNPHTINLQDRFGRANFSFTHKHDEHKAWILEHNDEGFIVLASHTQCVRYAMETWHIEEHVALDFEKTFLQDSFYYLNRIIEKTPEINIMHYIDIAKAGKKIKKNKLIFN